MHNQNPLQKARDYAFLLLKFRLRSEKEIYQRLKKKKFPEEVIKQTLSFLKDKAFIDDRTFTKTWIDCRLKRHLGLKRIKQELNLKGIDKEIIDNQIKETKQNYSEQDAVAELARQRLDRLKAIEPSVAQRRVYAYLLRRGFTCEVIQEAINQLKCRPIS